MRYEIQRGKRVTVRTYRPPGTAFEVTVRRADRDYANIPILKEKEDTHGPQGEQD